MTPSQYRKVWDFTKRVKQSSDLTAKAAFPRIAKLEGDTATLRRDVKVQGDQQDQGFAGLITWQLATENRLERLEFRDRPDSDEIVIADAAMEAAIQELHGPSVHINDDDIDAMRKAFLIALNHPDNRGVTALAAQKVDQ